MIITKDSPHVLLHLGKLYHYCPYSRSGKRAVIQKDRVEDVDGFYSPSVRKLFLKISFTLLIIEYPRVCQAINDCKMPISRDSSS